MKKYLAFLVVCNFVACTSHKVPDPGTYAKYTEGHEPYKFKRVVPNHLNPSAKFSGVKK